MCLKLGVANMTSPIKASSWVFLPWTCLSLETRRVKLTGAIFAEKLLFHPFFTLMGTSFIRINIQVFLFPFLGMCLILVIISLASIGGSTSCFDEIIYRCWHTLSLVLLSHHKTHPVMLTCIIRPPLLFLLTVCMLPCVVCKCLQVSFRDFVTLQGSEEELRFQRLRTLHVSGVASLTAWCRMQIVTPQLISFGNLPLIVCICFPYLLPSPWFPLTISSLSLAGWQSLL